MIHYQVLIEPIDNNLGKKLLEVSVLRKMPKQIVASAYGLEIDYSLKEDGYYIVGASNGYHFRVIFKREV